MERPPIEEAEQACDVLEKQGGQPRTERQLLAWIRHLEADRERMRGALYWSTAKLSECLAVYRAQGYDLDSLQRIIEKGSAALGSAEEPKGESPERGTGKDETALPCLDCHTASCGAVLDCVAYLEWKARNLPKPESGTGKGDIELPDERSGSPCVACCITKCPADGCVAYLDWRAFQPPKPESAGEVCERCSCWPNGWGCERAKEIGNCPAGKACPVCEGYNPSHLVPCLKCGGTGKAGGKP
jgi:hypothetical protein